MKRVKINGTVHFRSVPGSNLTLCGRMCGETDLFGNRVCEPQIVSDQVDCPSCAAIYSAIKNSPWNEVNHDVLAGSIVPALEV